MKRGLVIGVLAAAVAVLVVVGVVALGRGGDSGTYQVRAIFQNAFSVIPGEDVKVAGVNVGTIRSLDVNDRQQAVVVLDITRKGFTDWRSDAECQIRPQSLIGEKYVECTPTRARADGAAVPPPLRTIRDGEPGAGQHLLPVTQTSRPVDIDLLNNIMRLPYRQRFTILINEFGAGLAGRGDDLRGVIRKADPGLKETDRVLAILARQNKVLADLAQSSDAALAPVARDRARVSDFIDQAGQTATATAERSTDLQRNLQRLPALLRELTPTMQRLGGLADQAAPVLQDVDAVAPQFNTLIKQLGPFSAASAPALTRLGKAADVGRPALVASKPIIDRLGTFTRTAAPATGNLKALLQSVQKTGGVERLMDFLFYGVAAINGYDAFGHYLRAQLLVNTCTTYAVVPQPGCSANFIDTGADAAKASTASAKGKGAAQAALDAPGRSPALARLDAVLHGMSTGEALGQSPPSQDAGATAASASGTTDALALPTQLLPGAGARSTAATPAAKQTATRAKAAPGQGQSSGGASSSTGSEALLDYLLGGNG